jgi:hypothetical protein
MCAVVDFRWFARLLLEGKVIPGKSFSKVFRKARMAETPSVITAMKPSKKVFSHARMFLITQGEGDCDALCYSLLVMYEYWRDVIWR